MSEGRNLLEVVLNTNIAKKFNEVDNYVNSIQQSMERASVSAKTFADNLAMMTNAFNGQSTGDFVAKINALIDSMTRLGSTGSTVSGLTATQQGIDNIGLSAQENIVLIDKLIAAINELPNAFNNAKSKSGGGQKKPLLNELLYDTKQEEADRAAFERELNDLMAKIEASKHKITGALGLQPWEYSMSNFNTETQTLIRTMEEVRARFDSVGRELEEKIGKNDAIKKQYEQIKEWEKRIKEIEIEFKRLSANGSVFTTDDNGKKVFTERAKQLIEEKQLYEEKIKLAQMSSDEAIKAMQKEEDAERKKIAEEKKLEREKFAEISGYYNELLNLQTKRAKVGIQKGSKEALGFDTSEETRLIEIYDKKIKDVRKSIDDWGEGYEHLKKKAQEAYETKNIERRRDAEARHQKEIDQTTKKIDKLREAKQKEENQQLGITKDPKTIEQYRIALQNLQRQIEKTPIGSKVFKDLNEKAKRYKEELEKAVPTIQRFNRENLHLTSTLQRVASSFGVYLSLYGLVNFARNVATVTGEFEIQHRAMQAIIGDMDAANKLWDKTVRLAVRSPYSVKELVTYTKQLAAYRVETEKLYDTTKMLADISAGLGVDMQRLILAYGQVKAANYLRGQELRQFSEAGINILGELAKYFSELRGEVVSTGEVFDMVSKRMVKFEDVSEVLKRITEEGGIFYNMQEIQAETLKGMFMNLKDSLDLMKNEIGETNKGFLVGIVDMVKYLADNWKTVGNVMKGVIGIIVAFKVAQIAAASHMIKTSAAANIEAFSMGRLSKAIVGVITGMKGAKTATIGFSTALKNIPVIGWVLAILSAIIGVVSAITSQMKQANEFQEELTKIQAENNAETGKMIAQYKSLADKIKDTNTTESERAELLKKLQRIYGDILPQRMLEIDYIKQETGAYKEATQALRDYYQEKRREQLIEAVEAEYGERMTKAETSVAKQIQDAIKRSRDLDVSLSSITTALEEYKNAWMSGAITVDNMNEKLREFIEIQTGVNLTDSEIFLNQDNSLLGGWKDMFGANIENELLDFNNAIDEYVTKTDEASGSTGIFGASLQETFNEGLAQAEARFREESAKIKNNTNLTFDEMQRQLAEKSREIFGDFWNEFKLNGEYMSHKGFFDNLFNVKINPKLEEGQFTKAQETIAKKIDSLVSDMNVQHKQGLDAFLYNGRDSLNEYYDFIKKESERMSEDLRKAEAGLTDLTDDELARLREQEPLLAKFAEWLKEIFDPKKTHGNGGNKALELLNKQIDAIKRDNAEYKKYQELFDDTTAFNKTKEDFKDLFDELNLTPYINSISSFSDAVVKEAFESRYLKKFVTAAGKQGEIAGAKFRSGFQYEIDKLSFDEALDKANKEITKIFDQYDFGKELEKLGISKDMGKALFNVDSLDFNGMRQALQQIKNEVFDRQDAEGFDGKKVQEWLEKQEAKITELENKAQKERLESYINYMRQAMNQRAQIIYDGIKETADIEMTFQKEIEEARMAGDEKRVAELEVLMNRAMQGSKENTEKKLQNQAFEDFKGGELYIRMFEDLDNTSTRVLETMRKRLIEIKESMHELSPTELKAINSEIEKINNQLAQRSSFANLKESLEEAFAVVEKETGKTSTLGKLGDLFITGKTERKIGTEIANNEDEIAEQEALLAAIQAVLQAKENGNEVTLESVGISQEYARYLSMDVNALRQEEATEKANLKTKKDTQRELLNEEATLKKLRNSIKQHANQWKNTTSSIKSLISTVVENIELFGGETNHTTEAWGDLLGAIMDVLGMLPIYVASMAAAGTAVNASLGIIGLIAEAVQLVITLVAALVKMDDAAAQDQIDGIQNSVDRLSDAYDRLKDKFDEAWDVNKLKEYREALEANIKKQMSDYDAMIAVEKGRKNPDEEQIYEWQQAKLDLQDDYAEVIEDFKKEMGGIGTSGFKDAAQEFVDAWADAFIETGDGMEGLMEHFDEVLLNLVKKQAMQRVASRYLEGIFKMIDDAIGDNGTISTEQIEAIRQEFEQTVPQLSQSLKALFESLGIFGGEAENQLSGLEKGIQGVTEETAEIIAAYLNSIRFYIIDTNTKIGQLIAAIQDTTGMSNPMLQELRNIKQKTEEIRDFLYQRQEYGDNSLRVFVTNP